MKRTVAMVLADRTAALVQEHDVTDSLARLLGDCAEVLSAGAVGVLAWSDLGEIERLSSTSHAMAVLELLEVQQDEGPCIDAINTNGAVSVAGSATIIARWPSVGQQIVDAGYAAVHASPLRWYGRNLGAMNSFFADPRLLNKQQLVVAQAFADLASSVIMAPFALGEVDTAERMGLALAGRTIIEQAKGVIAQQRGIDMAAAYDLLVGMASQRQTSLTVVAKDFVRLAEQGSRPDGEVAVSGMGQ